jgi:hypothetical protein
VTSRLKVGDALGYCPFDLHEGIKCDMLKFLKVSKVVLTFLKTNFQSTLQNLPICHVVKKYIESRSKNFSLKI